MEKGKELELKTLIKKLEDIKGRGTELISLYIPQGYPLSNIRKEISNEMGTAENIKSKETRKSVVAALKTISEELKLYNEAPENGMAIFCGDIGGESKRDIEIWVVEPPIPLEVKKYRCDKDFLLEPLKELMAPGKGYGVIVIDNRHATIGLIKGRKVVPKREFESEIPGKFRAGGQCLAPETTVALKTGFKPISDLEVGESILAFDEEKNKVIGSKITDKWKRSKRTLKITTKTPKKVIFCSPCHQVFALNGKGKIEEKSVEKLHKGERLLALEGVPHKTKGKLSKELAKFYHSPLTSAKIKEIERSKPREMIDISVEQGNFIANGLLVHNSAARFKRRRRKMTLRFYRKVEDEAKKAFEREEIKGLIVGGPGPTKEKFLQKVSFPEHDILKVVSTNYTGKPGMKEALHKSEDILEKEEIVKEKQALEEFFTVMKKKPKHTVVGKEEIMKAIKFGAVEKVLLSEKLSTNEIKKIAKKAESQGGEVMLISDETDEGSQFQELGGYGAILRFPI